MGARCPRCGNALYQDGAHGVRHGLEVAHRPRAIRRAPSRPALQIPGIAPRRGDGVVKTGRMRTRKPPVLDPEATARKVAAMALGRAAAHRERLAAQAALLERLSEMPLEELKRHVTGRQWMAAVFVASGATEPELARALGLKGGKVSAHRLVKYPVVQRIVQLIRDEQLARVLRGEFGVQSQARAAAPAIMQNLTELAGAAAPDTEGKRAGRARRDADSIRAGELVLDV